MSTMLITTSKPRTEEGVPMPPPPKRPSCLSRPLPVRFRATLCLEALESRTLPASVFVVPLAVAEDASHFHAIADAVAAAGNGGLVTVEPGTDASGPIVFVSAEGITIQGDPNYEP